MKLFAAFGLALLAIQAAYGQASAPSTAEFVQKAAISDMFEIQSSQLAADKGSGEIKSFAQRMIKDHTKASQDLKAMADKLKVKIPTAMDAEHQAKIDQLKKLDGANFASTYARMQVEAHETAIKLFDAYASGGDNAELKAWAAKTLPTLKEHLAMAKKLK